MVQGRRDEEIVLKAQELRQSGMQYKEIAKILNISSRTASSYCDSLKIVDDNGVTRQKSYQYKIGDIVGDKILYYTEPTNYKNEYWYYICPCCGSVKGASTIGYIKNSATGISRQCKRMNLIGSENISDYQMHSIKKHAVLRNIEFAVSKEYLWKIFNNQKRICPYTGRVLFMKTNVYMKEHTASLDRINSNIGYVEGNVHWIHKDANQIKWDYDEKYFLEICKEITDFQELKNKNASR